MGICRADPKVRDYANQAQERLMMDPMAPDEGWAFGWVTMALTVLVQSGAAYVTVPREICRLIVEAVCQRPIHIRNGFYEYLQWGAGLQPKTCAPTCRSTFQAYERDNVTTLGTMLATPQIIRAYLSDPRDAGKRVLVQGNDQNNMTVLTTDPGSAKSAPGEYMVLKSPFVDSVNHFLGNLTGLMKDETFGPVSFFQVDPSTAVETSLSTLEPTEGTGWYRRYLIAGIPQLQNPCCNTTGSLQITAQGRLDFIPVANENDYLLIQNLPALNEECKCIRFNNMDSSGAVQQAALHHGQALGLLNGQLDAVYGKVNTAVKVPIFGSQPMRASFR